MKPISPAMQQIINGGHHLAMFLLVTGQAGPLLAITTSEDPITTNNIIYRADIPFTRSAVRLTSDFEKGGVDIKGRTDDESVRTLFRTGAFDRARAQLFLQSPENQGAGVLPLLYGYVGSTGIDENGSFQMEIRHVARRLEQTIGSVFQPECRADLGDALCTVDLVPLTKSGSISMVLSGYEYSRFQSRDVSVSGVPDDYWFAFGTIQWTSGANNGRYQEIKQGGTRSDLMAGTTHYILRIPALAPLAVGDTFTIAPGCDKRLETCTNKYANAGNFQGEPFMPGSDYVRRYALEPGG